MSSSPSSLSSSEATSPFEWVMDVPASLDVTLGTATLTVRECARLAVHSVIKLRQSAGSDLELRLAGRALASGEVVVSDENVSLKITRMLPPSSGDAA